MRIFSQINSYKRSMMKNMSVRNVTLKIIAQTVHKTHWAIFSNDFHLLINRYTFSRTPSCSILISIRSSFPSSFHDYNQKDQMLEWRDLNFEEFSTLDESENQEEVQRNARLNWTFWEGSERLFRSSPKDDELDNDLHEELLYEKCQHQGC